VSDARPAPMPRERAKAVRARAAAFVIAQREHSNWSEEEQGELDSWLAQSPAHMVAYLRVDSAWGKADRLSALRPPETESLLSRLRPVVLRAAAVFAVIAILGVVAASLVPRAPQDRVYTTPVGGRETVSFADGTQIELNTNTILRARMNTEQRIVWLEKGEAFFRVKHDRAHPFIVFVGDRRVTDLGTQFVVRREAKKFQVAVVQGRVWFDGSDAQDASQSALLTPGDVVTATADKMVMRKEAVRDITAELSWQHGVLVFNHTSLADAVAQINRYNAAKLTIANEDVAHLQIGGTFRATDPALFARAACTMLGLHLENRGNETVIVR
jgi:transmembrane sensor